MKLNYWKPEDETTLRKCFNAQGNHLQGQDSCEF